MGEEQINNTFLSDLQRKGLERAKITKLYWEYRYEIGAESWTEEYVEELKNHNKDSESIKNIKEDADRNFSNNSICSTCGCNIYQYES